MINELIDELKKLKRIDDDDELDAILANLENEDLLMDTELRDLDNLEGNDRNKILDEIEFIGRTYWKAAPEFRKQIQDLASKLIIKFIQGTFGKTHPLPAYTSIKSNTREIFDLDIERTVEQYVENPLSEPDLWVFERTQFSSPVILMIDTSFSMSGNKLMMAGLITGVLAKLIPSKDLCIMGFNKSTFYVKKFNEEIGLYYLISRILRLIPKGGTNLAKAIKKGSELIYNSLNHGKLILLSDIEPTLGKNPITEASFAPTLDILLFPAGNEWLAKSIIFEAGKGKVHKLKGLNDIPSILKEIFTN